MAKVNRYNRVWDDEKFDPAMIENYQIQQGESYCKANGTTLFYHYKNLFRLYWPDDDQHKWEDAILRAILANQFTTILGCAASCKTTTAAKFALCLYGVYPRGTTILISSTDLRGLELRVFGRIKELIGRAKERFDWFPGFVIDSKKIVCTDNLDEQEIRDMRHGIICFPAGTMVDTPSGSRAIESLQPGELVNNAIGSGRIKSTQTSISPKLIRVEISDGRYFDCTPEHPIFTQRGWVKADCLQTFDRVFSSDETMRLLREETRPRLSESKILFHNVSPFLDAEEVRSMRENVSPMEKKERKSLRPVLQHILRGMVGGETQGVHSDKNCLLQTLWQEDSEGALQPSVLLNDMPRHSKDGAMQGMRKGFYFDAIHQNSLPESVLQSILQAEMVSERVWQETSFGNIGRTQGLEPFSKINSSLSHLYGAAQSNIKKQQALVRGGHSVSKNKIGGGNGRRKTFNSSQATKRQEENRNSKQAWVESCQILEPGGDERFNKSIGGYQVFNLEVENHPSYSVNGVIVHNCIPCLSSSGSFVGLGRYIGIHNERVIFMGDEFQLMQLSLIQAIPNLLNNKYFKAIFLGNPLAQGDPLDYVSEPFHGWASVGIPKKTITWPTKYMKGICLNLPGLDSPNFDYPEDQPDKFPYMVGRRKVEQIKESYGEESQQYCSQILGVRIAGLNARKVVTREICDKFNAFDKPIWNDSNRKQIYAIDAAYGNIGGDRCMRMICEFGKGVDGKSIFAVVSYRIIPVSALSTTPPDDQIAEFSKMECETAGIAPEDVFFDGRTLLAAAFARLWSTKINPVDFGGPVTSRPVCSEMLVDADSGQRRLKRCDEHYSKFVTELWFSVRYAIESGQFRGMTDDILSDGMPREWKTTRGNKVEIESKVDTKKRTGKSPDIFDALVTAMEGARRRGFIITKLGDATPKKTSRFDWFSKTFEKTQKLNKDRQLQTV